MVPELIRCINYYLSEHPTIVGFRWSPTQSWGSTWSFLIFSISTYILTSIVLHFFLYIIGRKKPVPLGIVPAVYSLFMSLLFTTIFAGLLTSSAAEIQETKWFWRRFKTPIEWLLCFPLGTRPSGRVFFWSYIFYLSRFLQMFNTFFTILRNRTLSYVQLFNHSTLICMAFLWLEFSQSYQVLEILLTTLVFAVIYGYRFWTEIGMPRANFPFVVLNFQILLLACNLVGHIGVLPLHFLKGGCNGMGAWAFNSLVNGVVLFPLLRYYVKITRLSSQRYVVSLKPEPKW
ncbi:OLC1v1017869C1 [Oldenlandia corymbosa var. corymbosa]|uniref:OLC1v1017869C1 n=1 Tax=Oldenlandia corymbosa var. corymbosa TaxID=529605 RepID=A0AAV1EAD1_OLDCO|nr:OLC1v1017869C1 [Oldenlandia corymbosa var. corymbosa]